VLNHTGIAEGLENTDLLAILLHDRALLAPGETK
jgi:hypothetical protein